MVYDYFRQTYANVHNNYAGWWGEEGASNVRMLSAAASWPLWGCWRFGILILYNYTKLFLLVVLVCKIIDIMSIIIITWLLVELRFRFFFSVSAGIFDGSSFFLVPFNFIIFFSFRLADDFGSMHFIFVHNVNAADIKSFIHS